MKIKRIIVLLFFCFLFFETFVYAHPGRTDSNGGHKNSANGTYHYHHGYPAHQHVNGYCPYNFEDKTNSKNNSYKDLDSNNFSSKNKYDSTNKENVIDKNSDNNVSSKNNSVFFVFGILLFIFLCIYIKKKFIKNKEYKKFKEKYGNKKFSECVYIPEFYEIGSDGLPKEKDSKDWGGSLTVYLSKTGYCYHIKKGCGNSYIKEHLYKAQYKRSPCSKCHSRRINFEWYINYLKIKKDFLNFDPDRIDI